MAKTKKEKVTELLHEITAYKSVLLNNKYFQYFQNNVTPYFRQYDSSFDMYGSALDLILDILKDGFGKDIKQMVADVLQTVIGDIDIRPALDTGYHGVLNSLEEKLSEIETKQNNSSFINGLEDAVKATISTILTSFLTCSISPFIPYSALDKVYKNKNRLGDISIAPINIPTHILDFSNTLHTSPVSDTGKFFYNINFNKKYYRRNPDPIVNQTETVPGVTEEDAETTVTYTYSPVSSFDDLTDEERMFAEKEDSVPKSITLKSSDLPPAQIKYIIRCEYTAGSLYKTDDMNAFIWYVANRGDNYDETLQPDPEPGAEVMYEYNKMAWDTRRLNKRVESEARREPEDWENWLKSRTSWSMEEDTGTTSSNLEFIKDGKKIESLYPILQFEPSEAYGHLEHLIVTFPAQTYLTQKVIPPYENEQWDIHTNDFKINITKSIYKFNTDYLRSIKIFNWKTIVLNMLYELNGISPLPDVRYNGISLSTEIIDAKLSTLIMNTIKADDMDVDDSYFSFSNEDYSEALKRMELKKYGAKPYITASSTAIQNPSGAAIDAMNSIATAATFNEIASTITRAAYEVEGTSGSTGITKTTLSPVLSFETNFINDLLAAIIKPFTRALLSPQIMLLFCINLDTMGLINLKDLSTGDIDFVNDFIFRKIAGIIKKLAIQIKDTFIRYFLEVIWKEVKKLISDVGILLLLEQLNDYIRLLNQIMDCIRRFGIGTTVHGIDEVTYADIIPEANGPKIDLNDGRK